VLVEEARKRMMGALQLQSNGDGAAEGLLPDPGYVEVDPTGRYGRVRSIVFVFLSPLAFLFLLARLLLPLVVSCGRSWY
jgi:hypothetical protein